VQQLLRRLEMKGPEMIVMVAMEETGLPCTLQWACRAMAGVGLVRVGGRVGLLGVGPGQTRWSVCRHR
jgi:hypothetical protein